jgi:hypothetical protein
MISPWNVEPVDVQAVVPENDVGMASLLQLKRQHTRFELVDPEETRVV